jgi:class 3 adenylate cyclase
MPPELASQTLAFLFTDIEGSTRLWEQDHQSMKEALERHDAIVREAVESSNGRVVKRTGDGFMAVFGSVADGVRACLKAQHDLACARRGGRSAQRGLLWPDPQPDGTGHVGPTWQSGIAVGGRGVTGRRSVTRRIEVA